MAYKGKFNHQRSTNSDFSFAKEDDTSFSELDLGVDFDLSFLDDTPAKKPAPKAAAVPEAKPEKKASLFGKKAPEEKQAVEKKAAPAEKPVPEKKPAPVEKPIPEKKPAPAPAPKTVPERKAAPAAKPAAPVKSAPEKKPAAPMQAAPARRPAPAAQEGAKKPAPTAPVKKAAPAAPKAPAQQKPVAKAAPKAPAAPVAEPPKKKKRGPRIGGVIFYTMYFMMILAAAVATFIAMNYMHDWLSDYELAQPTYKAEQVFQQLFTDPAWGDLYDAAGAQDSPYEGKEEFVNYMEEKVGSSALNYMETSAGLSGGKKYLVRLGDEKVASFTLKDKNGVGEPNLANLQTITAIPDWQLSSVEVFFERVGTYRIEKVDGHTATVNGVALDDSFTIQVATTVAAGYLPEGTVGASMCLQEVSGIMELPEVKVLDREGNEMVVTYDEATRTFTERTESNTMTEDQETAALEAGKINCLWMIEEVKDRGQVAKYYDASSKPYSDITKLGELWMQGHAGYVFKNEAVSKFNSYGDDLYSVFVSMDLVVTRKDGTERNYDFDKTLFLKNFSGTWKVIDWTNEDVSKPIGKVRLTFMDGLTQIHSDLFQNDLNEIITPVLQTPEGKVFSGWATITESDGSTVYEIVFSPDESGRVVIPVGTVLEPMVLYAVFEDAGAAAPAEEG